MPEWKTYTEKFSETGLLVFERAAELTRERDQYHIAEGHVIVALFQIVPDWVAFRISENGALPEQILAAAQKEIEKTKPYTSGNLKIHPSAMDMFRKAKKFAKAAGRSQIDCLDLISALMTRVEDLMRMRNEFNLFPVKIYRRIKKYLFENKQKQKL